MSARCLSNDTLGRSTAMTFAKSFIDSAALGLFFVAAYFWLVIA
jgi:hypothetical protein